MVEPGGVVRIFDVECRNGIFRAHKDETQITKLSNPEKRKPVFLGEFKYMWIDMGERAISHRTSLLVR